MNPIFQNEFTHHTFRTYERQAYALRTSGVHITNQLSLF
jgi:hypothetical protein